MKKYFPCEMLGVTAKTGGKGCMEQMGLDGSTVTDINATCVYVHECVHVYTCVRFVYLKCMFA